jgi:hypothetical protein
MTSVVPSPVVRRRWHLALARRRRLLASGLVAAAVAAAIHLVAPPPQPTVPVWTAAGDLPAGHVLTAEDLVRSRWPPTAVQGPGGPRRRHRRRVGDSAAAG